jgi:ribose transport system substrate-binding protein
MKKMKLSAVNKALMAASVAGCICGVPTLAAAQSGGLDDPARAEYLKQLQGKTVAFLPIALSFDLAQGWLEGLKRELSPAGINLVVRDPNWDSNAGAQALTTLISQKPAVIVVHNPDLQTYAKLLKRAESEGIKIIQVNMRSVYPTSVYVGPDWIEVGERAATAVVKACEGKSGKVAIVQGPTSSAPSAYTLKGVQNILSKHTNISVVSSQAADWDAARAKGITQTVLRQNPDLCGIVGFWDGMDIGTAAAVDEAGLRGKVFLATSGGGEQKGTCDQVKSGAFDLDISYDVPSQAVSIASSIKWLLQVGDKANDAKGSIFSTLKPITKQNADLPGTCWTLNKSE